MALVVLLRGVNVGGHKTFRPALLAKEMRGFDLVNIGAAGTFVARKPGTRARLRSELERQLPFETRIVICEGRELLELMARDPFQGQPQTPEIVRFLSVLTGPPRTFPKMPIHLPPEGQWLVRILAREDRFVLGQYRRHLKTIGHLGALDRLFGVPATTRNWNTIEAIARALKTPGKPAVSPRRPRSAKGKS